MNMLRVEGLSVKYGQRRIIHDMSFELNSGDWLMVAGPNGAGKSTLVKALSGVLPFSGEISVMGDPLGKLRPHILAQRLGVLAQENHVGYGFTVEELVSLGRYAYRRGFFSDDRSRVSMDEIMELTAISDLRDRSVLTLSGGELQRVFLAQLLVQDPGILILDEPTSHLDLRCQKELFAMIRRWLDEGGRAVISVVHDLSLALSFGSHTLLMGNDDAIFGQSARVLTSEKLNRIYGMDVRQWMMDILSRWEAVGNDKASLRREIRLRQKEVYEAREDISRSIRDKVFSLPEYKSAGTVFCFVSTASEPETDGIISTALHEGKRVCVPRITGEGTMEAVEISSLSDLVPGSFNIREPTEKLPSVGKSMIDLALIPCMSCTGHGNRLGRGGGYYDRFLSDFSGSSVMVCPEALMSDTVPIEEHDISVPIVVTDKSIYRN